VTGPRLLYHFLRRVSDVDGRPWIFVQGLGRVSSGDEGLAELILCDPLGKFLWRLILQRPVRATLVIRLPYEVGVNDQLSANSPRL